jgi:hypothetical protein
MVDHNYDNITCSENVENSEAILYCYLVQKDPFMPVVISPHCCYVGHWSTMWSMYSIQNVSEIETTSGTSYICI